MNWDDFQVWVIREEKFPYRLSRESSGRVSEHTPSIRFVHKKSNFFISPNGVRCTDQCLQDGILPQTCKSTICDIKEERNNPNVTVFLYLKNPFPSLNSLRFDVKFIGRTIKLGNRMVCDIKTATQTHCVLLTIFVKYIQVPNLHLEIGLYDIGRTKEYPVLP